MDFIRKEPLMILGFIAIAVAYVSPTIWFLERKIWQKRGGKLLSATVAVLDFTPVTLLCYSIAMYEIEPSQMTALILWLGFLLKILPRHDRKQAGLRFLVLPFAVLPLLAAPVWIAWFVPKTDWRIMLTIVLVHVIISTIAFAVLVYKAEKYAEQN